MEFTTENSHYEVDVGKKKIRRLAGQKNPTERQGRDGEWKEYVELSNVAAGECALIVWNITETGTKQATMTSPIKEVESTVEEYMLYSLINKEL